MIYQGSSLLKFGPNFKENWGGKVNSASDFEENSFEKFNKKIIRRQQFLPVIGENNC